MSRDPMGAHNAALQQFMEGRAPQPEWCRCTPSDLMLIGCDCEPPARRRMSDDLLALAGWGHVRPRRK